MDRQQAAQPEFEVDLIFQPLLHSQQVSLTDPFCYKFHNESIDLFK